MASPRSRLTKPIFPGKLTEQSKHFSMVLCVEKVDRREWSAKDGPAQYCVIVGVGEDGHRQDCVFFGESNDNLPDNISVGTCFGLR